MSDLESRIRRLEDFEAIRQLKAYYAWACDDKFTDDHKPKSEAEIEAIIRPMVDVTFTEDAEWQGSPSVPPIKGREAICQRLCQSRWTFAMHYYLNPHITVDGDKAHATWMLWEPCTLESENKALWMSALTEDDYVRTPQGWRLKKYTVRLKFLTPYDKPWVK